MLRHPSWRSAGISDQQGLVLDAEVDGLANRLLKGGVKGKWSGMGSWTDMKTEQIYPDPGQLPVPPREPWVSTMAMAFLAVPLIVVSTLIWVPAMKNTTVTTALMVFWIGYICAWIGAGVSSKNHDEAVSRYWVKYDPHHRNRPQLRRELRSALDSALAQKWQEFRRPVATIPIPQVGTHPRAALSWLTLADRPGVAVVLAENRADMAGQR